MSRFIVFLLISLIGFGISVSAQSADDSWPVIERCVADAVSPPDEWYFDGTLLLRSLGKLHAYNQDWDTPRILVFYEIDIPGTGLLSPDGRWFVTIEGTRRDVGMVVQWHTESIVFHSTATDEEIVIEWENFFSAVHRLSGNMPHWFDNEHLLYSVGDNPYEAWFSINPSTREITRWDANFTPSWFSFLLAPDGQKSLHYEWPELYWVLEDGELQLEIPIFNTPIWKPDSTHFAGYTYQDNVSDLDQLLIFDLNGEVTDTIFTFPPDAQLIYRIGNGWSGDGHYLLFATDRLYIADMEEKVVFDTCIPTRALSIVWSPTSTQFALIDRVNSGREIQIFDIPTWTRYVVAYHSGEVIGWRTDD